MRASSVACMSLGLDYVKIGQQAFGGSMDLPLPAYQPNQELLLRFRALAVVNDDIGDSTAARSGVGRQPFVEAHSRSGVRKDPTAVEQDPVEVRIGVRVQAPAAHP